MPRQIPISAQTCVRSAGLRPGPILQAIRSRDFTFISLCLIFLAQLLNAADTAESPSPVSFSKDIAPLLQQKCATCHGPGKTKGGYQLHTFAALMKPGESKEAPVLASEPTRSRLFQLITAKDADDRMPQKDDPLPPPQIALIERWIKEGAKFDGADPGATLASLLPQASHPDPPASYARPVPILALAFSPDGRELAASGYHEIIIWNPSDGTLIRRIKNIPQQVQALSFNADGSMLAVCGGTPGQSGEAKLVNSKDGTVIKTLAVATDFLLTLAFSPDGQRLIVGGADNTIRIFNVADGKEERRIEQHADWVMGLAFSPDGARFASASRDKTARLFDTGTGELEETYDGHGAPVFSVAFSADGKRVFSGGRDREIHAWQSKDAKKIFEFGGFDAEVLRLLVHGDQLFSCSADKQVREHKPGNKKAELVRTHSGHHDVVYSLAYHEATKRLATGSFDGEVRMWDAENGNPLANFMAAPGYRAARKSSESASR
jgi:mono/diheme cytochrome c family protein